MQDATRDELTRLIGSDQVVLFMKGRRGAPQCGFSATVVEILDRYVPEYTTVDVLASPEIREGIKELSDWPTIPQLYVRGEFIGGCDIVRQMDDDGELVATLGEAVAEIPPPKVTITDAAVEVFRKAAKTEGGYDDDLRVIIDGSFRHDLSLGPSEARDIAVISNGIKLVFDPASARRAEGLVIDYVRGAQGEGFKIDNPNAPAVVHQSLPKEVKGWLDAGEPVRMLDVRTEQERATANIEPSTLIDSSNIRELLALPKDTKLVFFCHHGMRSYQAAQHFCQQGFRNVHNLVGGIDAWSEEIDHSIPRY